MDDRAGEAQGLLPLFCAGGGAAVPSCWAPEGAAAPSSFFFADSVILMEQEENVRKQRQKPEQEQNRDKVLTGPRRRSPMVSSEARSPGASQPEALAHEFQEQMRPRQPVRRQHRSMSE